jgi:hypothetical protein
MTVMPEQLSLDLLDIELAQHPFGNSAYIADRMHESYRKRLEGLVACMPAAAALLNQLDRIGAPAWYYAIGNTVVRCAIDRALRASAPNTKSVLSVQACEQTLAAISAELAGMRDCDGGLTFAGRLERSRLQQELWSPHPRDGVITQQFRSLVFDLLEIRLWAPDADERAVFARGVQLLNELLPEISASVLQHVHAVAVFAPEGPMAGSASSSDINLSGTIFLNRNKLRDPWVVAEHVFHEALHQQLYDFHQGHTMLEPNPVSANMVCSLWNLPTSIGDNYWGAWRTINAFHVYVHLTIFAAAAEQRDADLSEQFGAVASIGRRTASARAHYLGDQLRSACWDELTKAGKRWVDRFDAVLEAVDVSPPPKGAYLHLLLDRYWTEANMVKSLRDRITGQPMAQTQLLRLAADELRCVRGVLSEVDPSGQLEQFDRAVDTLPDLDPMDRFRQIRTLIVDTVLRASPDGGYTLDQGGGDQAIGDRIQRSSETLRNLLER